MIALLPLLLATAPAAADAAPMRRPVAVMATASVTIVRAERVEVKLQPDSRPQTDRQYRQRDSAPMVDFY